MSERPANLLASHMRHPPRIRLPSDPFEFVWRVRKAGHAWVSARPFGQYESSGPKRGKSKQGHAFEEEAARPVRCLTNDVPPGREIGPVKVYKPLSHPALFLDFAETEPTEAGVLVFANKWGMLLGAHGDLIKLAEPDANGEHAVVPGEQGGLWHDEILAMREARDLWGAVRDPSPNALKGLVGWESHRVAYVRGAFKATIVDERAQPDLWARLARDDLRKPAQLYLQRLANDHMHGHASPALLFDRHLVQMGLYVVPHTMLGALWLQFLRAVDGDRTYRRCRACRRWCEVGSEAKRMNSWCCRATCRMRLTRIGNRRGG